MSLISHLSSELGNDSIVDTVDVKDSKNIQTYVFKQRREEI